ncbi:efflux RND transporter periplasmic adaptor subunit [soil metagenome]
MRMSRRGIVATSAALLLALAAAGAYVRLKGADGDADGDLTASVDIPDVSATDQFSTDMAVAVEGAEVVLDTLVLSVSAAGEAASARQTAIKAQVGGQVRAVRVTENRSVGAGAVLIEIDPTEYQLALDEANARLRETEGRYREITLGQDRIDDPRVRAERDTAARARSGLDPARVAVQRAELNLRRTRVVAPFAGSIANLRVVPGQYASPGEELLTVQAMDPMLVQAQVLEGEIGLLAVGSIARVSFAAFPGEVFEGRIQTVNPIVEQPARTARVSVSIRNPGGRILPGMYARAALPARKFANRVLVPREAILERDRRTMLLVFEGEGTTGRAKWRYVNTGLMNDRLVEIVEEGPEDGMVQPGEIVLVGGHYTLVHDIPVRLVQNARAEGGRPQ